MRILNLGCPDDSAHIPRISSPAGAIVGFFRRRWQQASTRDGCRRHSSKTTLPCMSVQTSWLTWRLSRVSPTGVRRERFLAAGSRSKMVKIVMWRRDCLSCAAVRPLSAPLGAEAWLPYYIALLARVFESAGKLKSTAFMVRYAVPAVGETAAAELSSLLASGLGPQHA